ncbi:protein artemis [Anoplolepis gracilipes]|uniref:protein artemis n=1 Tax=Anoplolepis gracilipes TaxID=354296 RepID=UPI003B9EF9B1
MSTFFGLIEEIPGISVDRFDGENLNSSAYFLSHCHIDHTQGLSYKFFKHLRQYNKYLYCSQISKKFLKDKYCYIENCVKDIALNEKVSVEYKNKDKNTDILFVTCISAGHCPGSVMFLFETDKLVLYTGDFRINPEDYKKLTPLHSCKDFINMYPKKLAKIYLDTTFLDPNFAFFPTRDESENMICKVVKEWLEKNPRNFVVLECSALYGSEFLYVKLSKLFKTCIHIKDRVRNNYYCIPDIANYITDNPLVTRIHACMNKLDRSGLKCRSDVLEKNILTVVPSVFKWKGKDTSVIGEWDNTRERTFNVCYSTHASFDELKKFIQYFKPEEIYPCVCSEEVKYKIYYLLDEIKSKIKTKGNDAISNYEKYTLQVLKH